MVRHFGVKMDFIESAHLIDIDSGEVAWDDESLRTNGAYYLCFARKGFHFTRASPRQDAVLLGREYLGRHGRDYRIVVRGAESGLARVRGGPRRGPLREPEQRQRLRLLLPVPSLREAVPQVVRPRPPLQHRGRLCS